MKAVIIVSGGVVQTVYSDNPALEIIIVDHDDLASLVRECADDETEAAMGLTQV